MSELQRNVAFPPVTFALTCHPDQLTADGYSLPDIQKLFDWQDGKVKIDDPHERARLNRLSLLVIRANAG